MISGSAWHLVSTPASVAEIPTLREPTAKTPRRSEPWIRATGEHAFDRMLCAIEAIPYENAKLHCSGRRPERDDFASALEPAIARSSKGTPKMIDAKAVELPEWVVQASWLMVPTHETR